MEHFWDTVDTIGEGFGFSLFGARHLVTLALYIGFAALSCKLYKAADEKKRAQLRGLFAVLLLADEAFKQIGLQIGGNFNWDYLPLHLRSINIFLIALYAWKPSRLLDNFLYFICIPAATAALLVCGRGRAAGVCVGGVFAVFLAAALLHNGANLMLIITIMFTDAVQLGRIVFAHSGMGLGACMGAGACLSAGLFLLNAYSAGENADMFPHPIYAAVYYQLRWSAAVITAFVVGMLMLCFELEADANETTKAIMAAFVCFFGTRQLICAIGRLWKDMRINRVVCIAAGVAALITVLNKSALSAALNVIACAGMAGHIIYALSDSGWYFALMEDYRDRYVWHSIPHPDLMAEKEQDAGNGDI